MSVDTVFCPQCGASELADSHFCNECGARLDPPEEETAPLVLPARERPRGPRIAAVAALAVVVVVLVAIFAGVLLSSGDDEPARRVTIPAATDTPEPEATKARTAEPTPTATARTVSEDGYTWARPGSGWRVSARQTANGGARIVRELRGPGGALIVMVHTPAVPAQPAGSTVRSEDPFTASGVEDARKLVLENFPTDACQDRRCDDYVLNDPGFGGLAILASDSGGPASKAAARIARSVRAG